MGLGFSDQVLPLFRFIFVERFLWLAGSLAETFDKDVVRAAGEVGYPGLLVVSMVCVVTLLSFVMPKFVLLLPLIHR